MIETFSPYWFCCKSPCFLSLCSATFQVMGEFCRFSWGNGRGWGVNCDGFFQTNYIVEFIAWFDTLPMLLNLIDNG